jgi:hypothetical protein
MVDHERQDSRGYRCLCDVCRGHGIGIDAERLRRRIFGQYGLK